ncbi:hypothetical protein [Hymenobacter terrenus]|uniref:hypothetical protein n=1 Tax=Hymenobacter terrenus TaxID=1629124 RepID=UPI000619FE0F|nr:hypothetical protein [Hymenobacter terrenus]
MDYPVNLLNTRAECLIVRDDIDEDIERVQFRITALTRSSTLQTNAATEDAADISSLNDQIAPLETRVAGLPIGEVRTKEEIRLRALKRDREKLQDDQLSQGSRGLFRRQRELDGAQRQLLGLQDCRQQVMARHDALPA